MTGLTLYELTQNRAEFERLAESGELDPQTVLDTLEAIEGSIQEKAIRVAMFSRNLEATAQAVREAGKAMLERAARLEKRAASIEQYLLMNMQFSQITKIECPYFVVSIRRNPPAVVIDDEAALPAQYRVAPEPPPPRPDKKAIAAAIKAGESVPGARLVESDRLEIKE